MTYLLLLLATFSLGTGSATLTFQSQQECEAMRDRLLGLSSKAVHYLPFSVSIEGYCVERQP